MVLRQTVLWSSVKIKTAEQDFSTEPKKGAKMKVPIVFLPEQQRPSQLRPRPSSQHQRQSSHQRGKGHHRHRIFHVRVSSAGFSACCIAGFPTCWSAAVTGKLPTESRR